MMAIEMKFLKSLLMLLIYLGVKSLYIQLIKKDIL